VQVLEMEVSPVVENQEKEAVSSMPSVCPPVPSLSDRPRPAFSAAR